jgi:4-hydroxy-2-oxoheptanedioate aldolase
MVHEQQRSAGDPVTGLRDIWADRRSSLNGWCSIGNAFTAEIMAAQGFDSVTVDMQHGALDYTDLLPMLQAMRASGPTLMARVPWLDPAHVMKALDAGVEGVICPMIGTADEAARLVSYMRYPPDGIRSFGPTRAVFAHGAGYGAGANARVMAFAMIETAEGLTNLEAIVATPGLEGIYVGPNDLAMSVSAGRLPSGLDREEPEMQAHLKAIAEACARHGRIAAIHCGTADYAAKAVGWGYRMVTVGGDVRFLSAGAAEAVASFRRLTGGEAGKAGPKGY